MPTVIDLADAVVVELEAGTFSQAFTPVRRILPDFELAELATLRVSVVPKAVEITGATRASSQYDMQVDIGIQKHVGADRDDDVVGLCTLVDEIADWLRGRALGEAAYAQWVRTLNDPIYAPEHLLEKRVFTSVLTLTYRMVTI